MIIIICLLFSNVHITVSKCPSNMQIDVNSLNFTKFNHFWKSTGFCPPDPKENISDFLLGKGEKINLALIGSLPNQEIQQVRIHWLLNLLTSELVDGNLKYYNFTNLDTFLSFLFENGLQPGFELMGFPNSNLYLEKDQIFWRELTETIANRYIATFGAKYVSEWRFETYNEPDLKGFNSLNFTLPEYLDYVEGSRQGLERAFRSTNLKWKLGGPAGLFKDKNHPLCWGLLEYCSRIGIDACPVRFITFHSKGNGTAAAVLNGTLSLLDQIYQKFPSLSQLPIANDEADIQSNWSKPEEWRGDTRYAAMVVKVIADYYKSVRGNRKLKIEVLSNDNAFLNYHPFYFTQRTLFARFQINTTSPPSNQFIKKPVYSLMALLSYLGDEFVNVPTHPDPLLTIIATRRRPGQISLVSGRRSFVYGEKHSFVSVLVAYGNDSHLDDRRKVLKLDIGGLWGGEWKYLVYKLDNLCTNPYAVWKDIGAPVFPGRDKRRKMRDVEEPFRLVNATVLTNPVLNLNLTLFIPSIHLIHICSKSDINPEQVHTVRIVNITWNEVLVLWKYGSKNSECLLTYEVEFRSKCGAERENFKDFKRINLRDTIFTSFHHVGPDEDYPACEGTQGEYKIRAMDYWDRSGQYSEIIHYP